MHDQIKATIFKHTPPLREHLELVVVDEPGFFVQPVRHRFPKLRHEGDLLFRRLETVAQVAPVREVEPAL